MLSPHLPKAHLMSADAAARLESDFDNIVIGYSQI
jgi:hypothetical protein